MAAVKAKRKPKPMMEIGKKCAWFVNPSRRLPLFNQTWMIQYHDSLSGFIGNLYGVWILRLLDVIRFWWILLDFYMQK